eukprot:GEMP01033441.1.p1 GENE.GEMP01033441.1~~GEMP01033441.1.p1  ORF type:complete len:562 (+),score=128.39 GEMP01033441.1:72-1757(+)
MRKTGLSVGEQISFSRSHEKGSYAGEKIHPDDNDNENDTIEGMTRPTHRRATIGGTKRDTLTVPDEQMFEIQANLALLAKAQNTNTSTDRILMPHKHGKVYKISVFAPEETCGDGPPLMCEFDCIDPDDCETDEGEASNAASVCASPRAEIAEHNASVDPQEALVSHRYLWETERMQEGEEMWPNSALLVSDDGGDPKQEKDTNQEEEQLVDWRSCDMEKVPIIVVTHLREEAEFRTFGHKSTTIANETPLLVSYQDEHPAVKHAPDAPTITNSHEEPSRSMPALPPPHTEDKNPHKARWAPEDDTAPHVDGEYRKHTVGESSTAVEPKYSDALPSTESMGLTACTTERDELFPGTPMTLSSKCLKDVHFAKPSQATSGGKHHVTARDKVEDADCVLDAPPVVSTPTRQTVVETKVDALKDELELIRRKLEAMGGTDSAYAGCSTSEDRSCQTDLFLLEGLLASFAKATVDAAIQTEFRRQRGRQSTARSVRFSLPESEMSDHGLHVDNGNVNDTAADTVDQAPDLQDDLGTKSCEIANKGEYGVDNEDDGEREWVPVWSP